MLMLDWADEDIICDMFQIFCEAIKCAPFLSTYALLLSLTFIACVAL